MTYSKEHIDTLKEVIRRYRSITEKQVYKELEDFSAGKVPKKLKNKYVLNVFGTCLLCEQVYFPYHFFGMSDNCNKCILGQDDHFKRCKSHPSYILYDYEDLPPSPKAILKLLNDRADYLQSILNKYSMELLDELKKD
ncbi:MAG TPA: hypothetical protein VI815_02365 [Candidatus Nanoarchaeia archaeon]|nr:hypothetical protein [Candidatus Nanoarchaeia archaeon]